MVRGMSEERLDQAEGREGRLDRVEALLEQIAGYQAQAF